MTRHIHDTQLNAITQIKLGESQFDADAAIPLFLQPVGVGPGQGCDQCGLTVINMTGGAENEMTG